MIDTIISAGAGIVDTIAGWFGAKDNNEKNQDFTREMWEKNNEYNKPTMQMQRYKDAGLNPHLIYGQGNSGNSSMAPIPARQLPQTKFADAAMGYLAAKKQQYEVDNLAKAKEVMNADIELKKANSINAISNSNFTDVKKNQLLDMYGLVKDTATANLEGSLLSNKQIEQNLDLNLKRFGLESKMTSQNIAESSQRLIESIARVKNLALSGKLMKAQTEIENIKAGMWSKGLNPNDSATQQLIKQVTQPAIDTIKEWWQKLGLGNLLKF